MTLLSSEKNKRVIGCKNCFIAKCLPAALLVMSAAPAMAFDSEEMFCRIDNMTRKVFIQLENPPAAVPCEVMENKQIDSPESAVSLWSAGDDPNYCKNSLISYVEKLRGLGFECWPADGSVIIEPTASTD